MAALRVSEEDVKSSSAEAKLPYVIGMHKYALIKSDPMVVSATNLGLYMLSGPSGTTYRYLTL